MTVTGGSAHNATVRTAPRDRAAELKSCLDTVVAYCATAMSPVPGGGLIDALLVSPSHILDQLGVAYGPGSDLARRATERELEP